MNASEYDKWEENRGCRETLVTLVVIVIVGLIGQGGIATEMAFGVTLILAHVATYYFQIVGSVQREVRSVSWAILWLGIMVGWCTGGMAL